MKSRKVVIIFIIIVMILIIGVGGTLLYLTTDLFKTDKQIFFKYISQVGDTINEFKDTELVNYFEKQNTTPYESTGKFDANIKVPEDQELFKNANEFNITFNGKTDIANKKQEQKIQLNYSNDIFFPIEYKSDNDLYALGSNIVVNKFVAVKNENLKEFFTKCGVEDVSDVPDKIELLETETITDEEWKNISQRYYDVLQENLKDTNFSKIDKNAIALTLTEEETKSLLLALLEELKNDTALIEDSSSIEELIQSLQKVEATTDQCLKIVLHKENNKLTNIEIINADEEVINVQVDNSKIIITNNLSEDEEENITIIIEKIKQENSVSYNINCSKLEDEAFMEYYVKTEFKDITTQKAEERYVVGLRVNYDSEELLYEYEFDTEKTFVDTVQIEDITTDKAVILNDKEQAYITNLLNGIGNRVVQVNQKHMKQLGIDESEHPLILVTPIGYIAYETYKSTSDIITKAEQASKQYELAAQQEQQKIEEFTNNMDSLIEKTETQERELKNKQFEQYGGEAVNGAYVKALVSKVGAQLSQDDNTIRKIIYNNQEILVTQSNISIIQNDITTASKYEVSFEYNKNSKLIETIIIKKK